MIIQLNIFYTWLDTRVGKGWVGSGQGRKKGLGGSGSKNKVDPRVGKAGHFVEVASVQY